MNQIEKWKSDLTIGVVLLIVVLLAVFSRDAANLMESVHPRTNSQNHFVPANLAELHGRGEIFIAPLGGVQTVVSPDLIDYYGRKYGIHIHVLGPVVIPNWALDSMRNQFVAEELIEALKVAYPDLAKDPGKILIGVTSGDMFISQLDWNGAFNWRQEGRFAVVSTA